MSNTRTMSPPTFPSGVLTLNGNDGCYNPAPNVIYTLPSNEAERKRLNHQLFFSVRTLYGGKLIFAPGVELKSGDKVLDSGTGSGIWLSELAREVPTGVQLYGVDVQDQLFPISSTVPSNVNFFRHSILSLPAHWSGAFRFINQRLLVCAFTKMEWRTSLRETRRVLAPGGRAQFTEAHLPTHNAGPAMRKLEKAVQAVYTARGIYHRVPENLDVMLKDAGFVNVVNRTQMLPIGEWGGQDGISLAQIVIGMFSGHRGPIMKLELMEEADFDELLDAAVREWNERPGMCRVFTTIYADKPY